MESSTQDSAPSSNGQAPEPSPPITSADEAASLKALVAEQENIRHVIDEFVIAIKNGRFDGRASTALAHGLAFLNAVISQNRGHVENLKARLKSVESHG
jgi:hypothetical protein